MSSIEHSYRSNSLERNGSELFKDVLLENSLYNDTDSFCLRKSSHQLLPNLVKLRNVFLVVGYGSDELVC